MSDPKTSIASYASAGGAILFGLNANEVAAVVGAVCAIATFAINWYFKYQQLKMLEARVNAPLAEQYRALD